MEHDFKKRMLKIETPAYVCANGKCVDVIAVWDTGSTMSVITKDVADRLGVKPKCGVCANTLGGLVEHGICKVKVYLDKEISFNGYILCSEGRLSSDGRVGLIVGMDVISLGDFSVKSSGGKTVMTFEVP